MDEVDTFLDTIQTTPLSAREAAIRAARFTPVRLREGYDMSEVDRYLDELSEAYEAELVAASQPVPPLPTAPFPSSLPVTLADTPKSRLAPVEPDALRVKAEKVLSGFPSVTERKLAEAILTLLPYKERYESLEQALASQGFTHQ